MRITESKVRQIIKEEAARALSARRRLREGSEDDFGGSAAEADGAPRWVVGNSRYELIDAPRDVADAWSSFCDAVEGLEDFMNDTYPDTESDGEPLTIGDAAVHQAQTFLTER